MVQINELRIGNFVQEGKIEQIDNSIDEVYYSGDDYYLSNFCCNLKPITLTEEWLKHLGFIYDGGEGWISPIGEHFYFSLRSGFIHKMYRDTKFVGVKYVHQLQNLYFYLTQKELTL